MFEIRFRNILSQLHPPPPVPRSLVYVCVRTLGHRYKKNMGNFFKLGSAVFIKYPQLFFGPAQLVGCGCRTSRMLEVFSVSQLPDTLAVNADMCVTSYAYLACFFV